MVKIIISKQLGKLFFIQRICLKLKTKPTQEPCMQHSQDNLVVQELHQYFLLFKTWFNLHTFC